MKKKSTAQNFLERIEMLDRIIDGKLAEQRQWKDLAVSISANMGGEKVQSSRPVSRMADAVVSCIAMEDEVAEAVERLILEKRRITQVLEKLDNPTEYRLLHMRYVQYISLSEIARKLGKDYTWVSTTHGRALKNVQRIIEGGVCDSV